MQRTSKKPLPMDAFWLQIRMATTLIIFCSILAAILVSVDLSAILAFNDLFHILP